MIATEVFENASDNVIPLVSLSDLFTLNVFAVRLILFFKVSHADLGIRLNRSGNEGVASDNCILTDNCVAAKDRSISINSYVIAYSRMTLLS